MYNRKLCCKVPVVGPQGPQGPQGAPGLGAEDNALLFFDPLSLTGGGAAIGPTYSASDTASYGFEKYISSGQITFSSVPAGNYYVEIYAHCDAEAQSSGTNNYLIFELNRQTGSSGLNTVDIDTRSVQKGALSHLTLGPSAYRLAGPTGTIPSKTIDRASTYELQAQSGIDYALTEIKLIIKVRPYS